MSKRPSPGEEAGNAVHFGFRDELKSQRLKRRKKELILGLGAFSVVFAGGMLASNWPLAGMSSPNGSQDSSRPLSLLSAGSSPHFELCGMVRKTCVVDGDTFWLDGVKIRIADIDTPEISEPKCDSEYELGMKATYRLRDLLNEGPFELSSIGSRDEDRHGRKLRIVVRNGRSLGDQLVSEGLARTWSGRREPWC